MVKALVKDVLIMISGIGTGCVFCIKSKEEKAAIVKIVLKKSRKRAKLLLVQIAAQKWRSKKRRETVH